MRTHHITEENLSEAMYAVRVILDLYKRAITIHGGFGGHLFANEFDAFKYLRCEIEGNLRQRMGLDPDLLRKGAAVCLLCHLYDICKTFGKNHLRSHVLSRKIKRCLDNGLLDGLPLAKDAALLAYADEGIFAMKLQIVYLDYILGYYHGILALERNHAIRVQ
jgi:hypothetical protein